MRPRLGVLWLCLLASCSRIGFGLSEDAAAEHPPLVDLRHDQPACIPGARRCVDRYRLTCDPDGREVRELCELGCTPASCLQLLPSNGAPAGWAADAPTPWRLPTGVTTIDADTGTIVPAPPAEPTLITVAQGDGPSLTMLGFTSIEIPAGALVRVVGQRGLVLLAERIVVLGVLESRGLGGTPGAGGLRGGCAPGEAGLGSGGGAPGVPGSGVTDGGGGGGGHGSAGGAGGEDALGGSGGVAHGAPALIPLLGGSGGGAGSPGDAATAACGGAGGGALQLVARVELIVAGGIQASGGGGAAGAANASDGGGGGGGGSGGSILLEAPTVTITGALSVSGGGGGGTPKFLAPGSDGEDGPLRPHAAAGGIGNTDDGWGGAGSVGAEAGGAAPPGANNGGGGGGGAGRIRINAISIATTGTLNGLRSEGRPGSRAAP